MNSNDTFKPVFAPSVRTNNLTAQNGSISNLEISQSAINDLNVKYLNVGNITFLNDNGAIFSYTDEPVNIAGKKNFDVSGYPLIPPLNTWDASGSVLTIGGYLTAQVPEKANNIEETFFVITPNQNGGTKYYGSYYSGGYLQGTGNAFGTIGIFNTENFIQPKIYFDNNIINAFGNVNIYGNVDISGNLVVNGTVTATSYITSDYRIKTDIKSLDNNFTVDNLNPIKYTNLQNSHSEIGFLAHELQQEYPYLVSGEKDGETMQSVNYIGLIGILVNEIKSLKARVEILEKSQSKS